MTMLAAASPALRATGVACLLAVVASSAQAASASPERSVGLPKATLGMTLEAWRALPAPGQPRQASSAVCSAQTGASGPADRGGDLECVYRRIYGRFALEPTIVLPDGRRATGLRYAFRDGRLSQIAYRLSVDAYEATVAAFDARFGSTSQIVRDSVPTPSSRLSRVTRTWTAPDAIVQLIDPVAPYSQLEVRLSARAPVAQATARRTP